jgi:hypothetical protein
MLDVCGLGMVRVENVVDSLWVRKMQNLLELNMTNTMDPPTHFVVIGWHVAGGLCS